MSFDFIKLILIASRSTFFYFFSFRIFADIIWLQLDDASFLLHYCEIWFLIHYFRISFYLSKEKGFSYVFSLKRTSIYAVNMLKMLSMPQYLRLSLLYILVYLLIPVCAGAGRCKIAEVACKSASTPTEIDTSLYGTIFPIRLLWFAFE